MAVLLRDKMKAEIRLRGLAENTEKAYLRYAHDFAEFHHQRPPARLARTEVKAYFVHLTEGRHLRPATLVVALAAVRFLFATVLRRPWVVADLPWPKVVSMMPVLLAVDEVIRLLDCITSLPLRTLAATIYATGLRDDEVRSLAPRDIDSARNVIVVRRTKGGRQREVPLGVELLRRLREYWRIARPQGPYLFPGRVPGRPFTRNALAQALRNAARAAGISKRVSAHVLRHSAATHFLEMGCNQRVIQVILGHRRIETTERYTQVRAQTVSSLRTPLDDIAARTDKPVQP